MSDLLLLPVTQTGGRLHDAGEGLIQEERMSRKNQISRPFPLAVKLSSSAVMWKDQIVAGLY